MMMSGTYIYIARLALDLFCRWLCKDLTLTLGALLFIWSADDDVMNLQLPWKPYTSSDLHMIMSRPYSYIMTLAPHVIWRWWCPILTVTLGPLYFIWSVDDDVITLYLPWEPYTSSDLPMMTSILRTYHGSLTLLLICRWWPYTYL